MDGMANMKVIFLLAVSISSCVRRVYCGEHPDGISEVSRAQDAVGNYHFSYSVANGEGDQFRKEGTDAQGRIVGSYGLTHNDGTHRVVDYIADKNGFRAEIRSNEPGVISAEAADASIIRTDHPSQPLSVAATSNDDSRESFGKRLRGTSRVAYVEAPEKVIKAEDQLDEGAKESRQSKFEDYRPLSPVAYYPRDAGGPVSSRLTPPVQRPVDILRSPRVLAQPSAGERTPVDVYFPPIDPHSALRRPATYVPRDSNSERNFYTTTSRKPFIPPYGGFDDDPVPEPRRPDISMTTIHGGRLGSRRHLPSPSPTPVYGAGRYPSADVPGQRDFTLPRLPPLGSGFPSSVPHLSRGALPPFSQGLPNTPLFNPPSYENGIGSPNFVLRAVPIPNGIQAVRVDPNTGQIYERLVYPLYLRHDGHPAYDKNILLHNDDVTDDDATQNENDSGYFDIPFPSRAAYRGTRDQPFDEGDRDRTSGRYNVSYIIDESSLSKPTADDMASLHRQLSAVEGFDSDRFANRYLPNSLSYRDSEYLPGDQFENNRERFGTSSQLRMRYPPGLFDYTNRDAFPRNPRNGDVLSQEDSKEIASKLVEDREPSAKDPKERVSQIEKEGM